MKQLFISGILSAVVTPLIFTTPAKSAIFEITGDIENFSPSTVLGNFRIVINDNDNPQQLFEADITESNIGLINEPWYGYNVSEATASVDGVLYDETDIISFSPFSSPINAEIWFEEPISLNSNLFLVDFDRGFTDNLLLGGTTNNRIGWLIQNSGFAYLPTEGFQVKISNVTVKQVPEPLTMLGTGSALAFGTVFKRKLAKTKKK
ncbi:PEP-CTERM sorting domain-containing protein [Crocosphaera chwakensis]|uniref:PEP-CTERM protein-sorting domain-containing protein n=1 Tax=Crocosphaera chwakensis CCY0110 TaxID=391612 RepID=A3J017_9CHRO|nr:PEP-CTERM sorting domain-containing protein [Crocosphaera chwakensis]EAZ87929.1 hypothetical protein CY0110_00890 [Crocosphaera chwakensis CCY0110]